jgi:hypothetical protein
MLIRIKPMSFDHVSYLFVLVGATDGDFVWLDPDVLDTLLV